MGGKREYTAIFSIGAKLLGSFRGAMAAAQSRLRGLQAAAMRVGGALKGLKFIFSGLIGALGGFFLGKIFSTIFGTATEEAIQAEQRVRSLTASLMLVPKYRKAGEVAAKRQIDLIMKHNALLEQQGVLHQDNLNNMAVELAQAQLSPGAIQDTIDVMQNLLIKWKGVTATEEDATAMGDMWRRTLTSKKVPLELAKVLGLTLKQVEALKKMAPQQRQDEMIKYAKRLGDLNKQARDTPVGKIQIFRNMIRTMANDIGDQLLPAQAELAAAWTKALPELGPLLVGGLKVILWLITKLGNIIRTQLIPWWHEFQKTERFEKLKGVFKWIQDHAKQIAIAVGLIVAALVGINVLVGIIGIITAIASPIGLIAIAILAVVAAFAALYIYWDKLKSIPVLGTILEGYKDSLMVFINLLKAIGLTVLAVFTGDWQTAGEAWKTLWTSIVALFEWGKDVIANVFMFIGDAAQKYFVRVLENAKTAWDYFTHPSKIIDAFSKLPIPADVQAGTGGYQHGGIISRPTMAMMGEYGRREAVIPLSGGPRAAGLLSYANRALGMGGGSGTNVTFAPIVNINGPATEKEQALMDIKLRDLARDFVDNFKRAQRHERRLSYEGGYG